MILKCKNLNYLDDRPITPRDRACAEAWMRSGPDEEAAERRRWIQADQKKINDSVQALINKRKLYKPVAMSEKEAEDKKKTKEDEEVAKLVCTSNELLNLEKKKSEVSSSSSSSASSSSDEEVENDGTGQKGAEKSGGRRPMAEEERKAYSRIGAELLLPWRTETSKSPPKLIEEIRESKEYVASDADLEWQRKKILDERRTTDDPPGGYALGRELAHYEKLVLGTTNETEIAAGSCTSDQKKNDDTNDRTTLYKNCSVSCDILDSEINEEKKISKVTENLEKQPPSKDILDDYRRRDDRCPLSSQLTSIRKDMKEFCVRMEKFVEENKICFKNGDVEGFWGKKDHGNPASVPDENEKQEEKQSTMSTLQVSSTTGNDDLKWWNAKERKLKMVEIMKKRDEEAMKKMEKVTVDIKDVPKTNSNERTSRNEDAEEKRETSSFQGVYDLLNLKTCSKLLLQDVKTYPENEDDSISCRSPKREENKEVATGVFHSLFNELEHNNPRNVKFERTPISRSSHELLPIAETEETDEEVPQDTSNTIRRCVSADAIHSNANNLQSKKCLDAVREGPVQIETVKVDSEDGESDNESVITVIDCYEKCTKVNVQPRNFNQKSESIDTIVGATEEKKTVKSDGKVPKMEKEDQSSDVQALSTLITSLYADKSRQPSKSCKRGRDYECMDIVVSKKSHLIENDAEVESSVQKNDGVASDSRERHRTREAWKFSKEESPLIDSCIESLIMNKDIETNTKSSKCDQMDFFTCTTSSLISSNFSSPRILENSAKAVSTNEQSREDESVRNSNDIRSIAELLKQSETAEKQGPSIMKNSLDFYQEFCQYFDRLKGERKLLIEPDFMKNNRIDPEEKKRDALSPGETKQSENKQTKPLIEVISTNPTNVDALGESEEPPVNLEDPTMDAGLKDRILKSINAPKSEQWVVKAKTSAERLMKISRDIMAVRKFLLQQPLDSCNQQRQFDDSRKFFMNLLEDSAYGTQGVTDHTQCASENNESGAKTKKVSETGSTETEEATEVSVNGDDDAQEKEIPDASVGKARKSLEMQVVEEN
ncbi:dynein axonemal assembly factor 1 homolog [Hylaeus volcanicus]|uniref:dynein axonemal assembly factor 1 homolog n=1 Tax=Hylaeus volcanicus TaxID=313075 RepID=UPI0023B844BB|nr:dynein axonemal assembly factor 1 homolog [Hylaeus volcanicus]